MAKINRYEVIIINVINIYTNSPIDERLKLKFI